MCGTIHSMSILQDCRKIWSLLALCAVVASVCGILFADAVGDHYLLLMRMATGCRVSIVGTAVSVMMPFLVSLFFIVHSKPWLAYLACILHISDFSAAAYAIAASFNSAGWLIRQMMQFSDLCLIPILLNFCACRLGNKISTRMIAIGIMFVMIIGMIDYGLISPFLANLIEDYETMGRYAIHVGFD